MKDRLIRFACYFVKNKEKFIPFNVKIPSRKTKRAKAGSVRGKFDLKNAENAENDMLRERERERSNGHAPKNSDLTYAALPLLHRRQIVVIQIIPPRSL